MLLCLHNYFRKWDTPFYLVRKYRVIYLPFLLIQTLRLILVFQFMTQVAMSVIVHPGFPVSGLFAGISI